MIRPEGKPMKIIFTEAFYDRAVKMNGPNCGFDPSKVIAVRGFPKETKSKKIKP